MYFKIDRDQKQGTGCHKGSQKLLKDRVEGVTKTLNRQGGITKGTKNFK